MAATLVADYISGYNACMNFLFGRRFLGALGSIT